MTVQLRILIRRIRSEHEESSEMFHRMYGDYAKSLCFEYVEDRVVQAKVLELGLLKVRKCIHDFDLDGDDAGFVEWIRKKVLSAVIIYLRENLELHSFIDRESKKIPVLADCEVDGIGVPRSTVREFFSLLPSSSKLVLILVKVHGFSAIELAQCFDISIRQAELHQAEVIERMSRFLSGVTVRQSDLVSIDRIWLS